MRSQKNVIGNKRPKYEYHWDPSDRPSMKDGKPETSTELECGPMPNLMVALPNIGGALCSTPQSLADAHY